MCVTTIVNRKVKCHARCIILLASLALPFDRNLDNLKVIYFDSVASFVSVEKQELQFTKHA